MINVNPNFEAQQAMTNNYIEQNSDVAFNTIILCADRSGSMHDRAIELLNQFLAHLAEDIRHTAGLKAFERSLLVGMVSYATSCTIDVFPVPVGEFNPPALNASGLTYTGDAMELCGNLNAVIDGEAHQNKSLIILLSDGVIDSDNIATAKNFIKNRPQNMQVLPVAVGNHAAKDQLAALSTMKDQAVISMNSTTNASLYKALENVLTASISTYSSRAFGQFQPLDLSMLCQPDDGIELYIPNQTIFL